MTANQKKLQIINTREPFSPIFKDILCSKNSSKYISPFLQNILMPLEVFRYPREINRKIQRIPILRG